MKLLFLILLFSGFSTFAQTEATNPTYGHFKFANNERRVSWINVFNADSTLPVEVIKKYFTDNRIINVVKDNNLELTGDLIKAKVDVIKYGVSSFNAPIIFGSELIGNVIVELKKGRYRVTINNIRFINNGAGDVILKAIAENAPTTKGNEDAIDGMLSL